MITEGKRPFLMSLPNLSASGEPPSRATRIISIRKRIDSSAVVSGGSSGSSRASADDTSSRVTRRCAASRPTLKCCANSEANSDFPPPPGQEPFYEDHLNLRFATRQSSPAHPGAPPRVPPFGRCTELRCLAADAVRPRCARVQASLVDIVHLTPLRRKKNLRARPPLAMLRQLYN